MSVSPLRYPGGKTRACRILDDIINQYFNISNIKEVISPFFGGGSFEFYLNKKYKLTVKGNDKFKPLIEFWNCCKTTTLKKELCEKLSLYLDNVDKEKFIEFRSKVMNEENILLQAYMYFIINRCSFSGSTLSGGFSLEASKKRFTTSSIKKIKDLDLEDFTFTNLDFEEFINRYYEQSNDKLLFLDPPYYLEKKSKLYGKNGDLHENFDHEGLYKCLISKKNWILTYNSCEYIKDLYKNFKIIETSWSYSMNQSKISSEIVIIGL